VRLLELIRTAPEWRDDDTSIYVVRSWSCDADAILISPSPETTEPIERHGVKYHYFLETFIAREVIEDYLASEQGRHASDRHLCQRVIAYAENDA